MIKNKKLTILNKPEILNIHWYPGAKIGNPKNSNKGKLENMPPLMVRKAEWRK